MQITITQMHTRFPERNVEVTVQLTEQNGQIKRIAETLTFVINKPYTGMSAALDYECALFLSQNGYDVSVPDVPPEGLLQEVSDPIPMP